MATTNIGLLKTATSDTLGTAFTDFNSNMDKLDTLSGSLAKPFAVGTAYAAGEYVLYTDGVVYLLPEGHTANTTWANTTKTATKLGVVAANFAAELDATKSAITSKEISGHSGVGYTGVKFAGSNTTVASGKGSVAVYRIDDASIVTVKLKYASVPNKVLINRNGIALSDNPVPTINETIARVNSTAEISTDAVIKFQNNGYKYCYVYYSSEEYGEPLNDYVTVETDLNKNALAITGFTQGGITWTTGANRNSSSQYRSDMLYCPWAYIEFDLPNNISFRVAWYKTSSVSDWVSSDDLISNSRAIRKKADYFRFIITTSDTTPALPSDEQRDSVYIQKARSPLYGLKASFLGDSLTTFTGYSEDSEGGTIYADERYPGLGTGNDVLTVDQTWWKQVLTGLEMNLGAISAISQTTIVYKDLSGDPPIYPCMSTSERITRLGSNGIPDIIFIFAGTNDCFSGVATVGEFTTELGITALEAANPQTTGVDANLMIRKIQQAYPNALIVGIIPKLSKYVINGGSNTFTADKWYTVCEMLIKAYKHCDANYIVDLREMPLNGSNMNDYIFDNVHFNAAGMRLMSNFVICKLLN